MTPKQLSTKIYNAVKAYCHKLAELQQEAIKFNEEMKQYLEGKK